VALVRVADICSWLKTCGDMSRMDEALSIISDGLQVRLSQSRQHFWGLLLTPNLKIVAIKASTVMYHYMDNDGLLFKDQGCGSGRIRTLFARSGLSLSGPFSKAF
jgi:hypothetical protein